MTAQPQVARVVVVAFDEVQLLDVAGPLEVFTGANRAAKVPRYDVTVAALADAVTTSSGVRMQVHPLSAVRGPVDTLIVAGGDRLLDGEHDPHLLDHLRRLARSARRTCSVCSGALLLAAAGLLSGRTATTHWAAAAVLASRHPDVRVDADPIYLEDGRVWTSAGVSAAVDLSLALVAADLGTAVANRIARWMVLPARRTGLQSQFAPQARTHDIDDEVIGGLVQLLEDEPQRGLTVEAMARHAHLSPRQLARRFAAATGVTPARFSLQLRLDHARSLLESTDLDIGTIARQCGFNSHEAFNRAFARRFGTSPSRHRAEFALPLRERRALDRHRTGHAAHVRVDA